MKRFTEAPEAAGVPGLPEPAYSAGFDPAGIARHLRDGPLGIRWASVGYPLGIRKAFRGLWWAIQEQEPV